MATHARPLTIAISGAHGAGKSTVVAELHRQLVAGGVPTRRAYLYGCVICRRAPGRLADWTLKRAAQKATGEPKPGRVMVVERLHALLDATELTLRLGWAQRRGANGPGAVLLLDRAVLDGLAKHEPAEGSLARWFYRQAACRLRRTFWLDSEAQELSDRLAQAQRQRLSGVSRVLSPEGDARRGPTAMRVALEIVRERYARAAATLSDVQRVDTTGCAAPDVAGDLLRQVEALRS